MANGEEKHEISLFVSNKPGVLIRISLIFARRGYNIDSLVVSQSHDPAFSHMNIVASGDKQTLDQILKQLNKLVDVVHASDYTGKDIIEREMALMKVSCPTADRAEILQVAHAFESQVIDMTENAVILQVSGETTKLDAADRVFNKYGVMENIRSGKILITRGDQKPT